MANSSLARWSRGAGLHVKARAMPQCCVVLELIAVTPADTTWIRANRGSQPSRDDPSASPHGLDHQTAIHPWAPQRSRFCTGSKGTPDTRRSFDTDANLPETRQTT
jgi:hypothetical protein